MRLVALSDTHSAGPLMGKLPDGDVLVHCGDHTVYGGYLECEQALQWLGRQPHRVKWVIPGNHDVLAAKDPEAWAHLCRTYGLVDLNVDKALQNSLGLEVDGFAASPSSRLRSPSPAFGAFQYLRAWGFDWSCLIRPRLDLLVTHGPPEGILDQVDERTRAGCKDLRDALSRMTWAEAAPKLHLLGHIHESAGMEQWGGTIHCNVSTDHGKLPATVLDYNDGQWTWMSGPGG